MSRSLVMFAALLALSGCSYSIQGSPVAEPLPPGPAVATPRKTADIDPCQLVTAADLKPIGTMKARNPRKEIPNSCIFQTTEGPYVIAAAPYRAFDESKKSQTKGKEVSTSKHATWLNCGKSDADMVCTATIAVSRNESLLVAIGVPNGTEAKAVELLEPIGQAALKRLPAS